MSNPLLKDILLDEVEKCKAAGMSQTQIIAHVCNPTVARALELRAKFKLV